MLPETASDLRILAGTIKTSLRPLLPLVLKLGWPEVGSMASTEASIGERSY